MTDTPVGIEEGIQPELEEIVSGFERLSISPAPRPPNWFGSQWRINQLPGSIIYQSIIFFIHHLFPLIMRSGFFEGIWFEICR